MSNVFRTGYLSIDFFEAKKRFDNAEQIFVSFNCSALFTWINFETKLCEIPNSNSFKNSLDLVKMKNVFPHQLNRTFFYVEELKPVEVINNQLAFNFFDN